MPNFPVKTALALATALAVLAAYRLVDPGKGLSPAIFPDAAQLTLMRRNPATHPPKTPLNGIQPPKSGVEGPSSSHTAQGQDSSEDCPLPAIASGSGRPLRRQTPVSPYLLDPCRSLDPLFAALHARETGTSRGVLSILHYGDSPTTADLITGDVRELLQQRFGDAGRGFLLAAKPWAWYEHRGVDLSDKNWTISTAVGKGREEVYGLGGASFEGTPEASSRITLKAPAEAGAALEIAFLTRPNSGSLAVSANGVPLETFPTGLGDQPPHPDWHTLELPAGTRTIDLKPTGGNVRLFGETLLTGQPGVLYDSLGLNGASTSVLSNGFNAAAWTAALQHTQPKLVIINYGTNESGFGSYVDKQYEPTLRTAIARIRAAIPGVPILIMSPMDRGRRSGVDQIETYDTIPRIVAIQQRVAAELNCAFFDTFNAMGGEGTMSRWYTGHPRLVAGDLIHPTPQGATIVARLFVHDLSLAYDRYLGDAPPPARQTASSRPPANIALPATPPSRPTIPSAAASNRQPTAVGDPLPTPTLRPTTPDATIPERPQT